MSYQIRNRGVEASGTTTQQRERFRSIGREFDLMLRTEVTAMASRCPEVPAPRQLFYDVAPDRARPASMAAMGQAIAALAADPELPDLELMRFAEHVIAFMLSLRPMPEISLANCWERETRIQASADIAQARALRALETKDLAALDAAISESSAHLAEQQLLTARLIAARRQVNAQPRTAFRVVNTSRLVASESNA